MVHTIDTEHILNETKLFWQYPVITEEEFYNQNKKKPNYFGFPWATIIDKRINTNDIFKYLINKVNKNVKYYTCCQHIYFRKLIPLFKVLGIYIVYTPHKIIGENEVNGVKLLPCPLYAVNYEDDTRNMEFKNIDFLTCTRKYLYSFMGGVQSGYLTNIRNNIFNMKHDNQSSIVINTGNWHFNSSVYSTKQNHNKDTNIDMNHIDRTKKYNELLLDSTFSLCPSGSGPNSIRFWESLACGSIPVLLADTLELPYDIDWDSAIIRVKEEDYLSIPETLAKIDSKRIESMRKKCLEVYDVLHNNFSNIQNTLFCKK